MAKSVAQANLLLMGALLTGIKACAMEQCLFMEIPGGDLNKRMSVNAMSCKQLSFICRR